MFDWVVNTPLERDIEIERERERSTKKLTAGRMFDSLLLSCVDIYYTQCATGPRRRKYTLFCISNRFISN